MSLPFRLSQVRLVYNFLSGQNITFITHTHGRNIDALYELVGEASSEYRRPEKIHPDKIRSAILEDAKSLWCQGFADRQAHRTGGGSRCIKRERSK